MDIKVIIGLIALGILVVGMCMGPKSSGTSQDHKNNGIPQNKNVGPREKKPLAHALRGARDMDYFDKYFDNNKKK